MTFEQHEDGVTICVVQADGKKIEQNNNKLIKKYDGHRLEKI